TSFASSLPGAWSCPLFPYTTLFRSRSGATSGAAAANASRSGMSRFLGPIAGIAAGLGIAALLSHLGLSGALLEFLSSAILIGLRSEEHTSELQSRENLVCRLLLEKK